MKILLLGDSIREGYDRVVKEALEGTAEVFYPNENCRFASYTFRNLHVWKNQLKLDNVDIVHWNAGLWDVLRLYGDFETLTKPDVYAEYIERIQKRIMFLFPGTKSIFATSTPVWEEKFVQTDAIRSNSDIEKYNAIARDVLSGYAVEINDLYALMKDKPLTLHSDMTHYYTEEATELISGQVISILKKAIEKKTANI